MAIFGFLKKGEKKKEEGRGILPPPKPRIEEIPSFPFEKEELLPPIKPMKSEIRPLAERMPLPEEKDFENFIPKPPMPEKPKPELKKIREDVVVERPVFEREIFEEEIEPQTISMKPMRSAFAPQMVEVKENVPYIRVYKFKEVVEDINQIAKSLRKVPTRIKSQGVDEAYESFEKSLDMIMKNIDSIERSIFE